MHVSSYEKAFWNELFCHLSTIPFNGESGMLWFSRNSWTRWIGDHLNVEPLDFSISDYYSLRLWIGLKKPSLYCEQPKPKETQKKTIDNMNNPNLA